MSASYPLKKKLLIALPILAAIAFFALMVGSKKAPETRPAAERATAVTVLAAPAVDLVPRAVGYGYVRPELVWDGVAEVAGQVVEMNPELRRGAVVAEGEVLLRIDPAKRITATDQSEAEVRRLLARIAELDQRAENLRASLTTEQRSLELSRAELSRRERLAEDGTIARSELDLEEKRFLTQKNVVQNLQNELALIPSERRDLSAQLAQARSRLTDARIDLGKTEIRAPFDARVREVNVESGQAVRVGDVIARLDSVGVAETLAEFPLYSFRNIVPPDMVPVATLMPGSAEQPEATTQQSPDGPSPLVRMQRLRDALRVSALVRVAIGGDEVTWSGRLVRMREGVDPTTRTIGAYVAVDNPYLRAVPGRRPPLMRNMYCEVELRGEPRPGSIVVPRTALRRQPDGSDMLAVVDADNRLVRRAVTIGLTQGSLALVTSGLEPGERVVVSQLPYAVEGMLLNPVPDEAARDALIAEAEATDTVAGELLEAPVAEGE